MLAGVAASRWDDRPVSGWRIEELDEGGGPRDPRFDPLELGALVVAFVVGIAVLAGFVNGTPTVDEPVLGELTPLPASPNAFRVDRPGQVPVYDRSGQAVIYVAVDDPAGQQHIFRLEGDRLLTGPSCVPARLGAPLPSPMLLVRSDQLESEPLPGGPPQSVLLSCYQYVPPLGP